MKDYANKAIIDGERYALWPDGTFCKLSEIKTHLHSKGAGYQEVIGIGRDDLTLKAGVIASSPISTFRTPCRAVPRLALRIRPYDILTRIKA